MRGVAAMAVVLYHADAPGFIHGGYGVDLFFVLSGFVITRLLTDEYQRYGNVDLARFYVARLNRLYPALLFFLLVYLALAPIAWPGWHHTRDALTAAVFFTDWTWSFYTTPPILRHTWSLSVEFHFYLIWPLILTWLLKQDRRVKIITLVTLYLSVFAWRSAVEQGFGPYAFPWHAFETRSTGLIAGSAIALFPFRVSTIEALIAAAFLALMIALPAPITYGLTLPVVELCAALIILALSEHPGALNYRPLVFLGAISYALYLWHFPVNRFMNGTPWQVDAVVTTALAVTMATISWFFIEKPMAQLRRRRR